jgi:hypothetical protein
VRAPIDVDRLWPSLRAAEDASRRGTELLQALHRLLVRNNPSSRAWQEERRKVLDAIEAHLAAVTDVEAALDTEQQPTHSTQKHPVVQSSANDDKDERVA